MIGLWGAWLYPWSKQLMGSYLLGCWMVNLEFIVIIALKCKFWPWHFLYIYLLPGHHDLELIFFEIIIIFSCPHDDLLYYNLKAPEQGKCRTNTWSEEQHECFLLLNWFFQVIVKAMRKGTNLDRLYIVIQVSKLLTPSNGMNSSLKITSSKY